MASGHTGCRYQYLAVFYKIHGYIHQKKFCNIGLRMVTPLPTRMDPAVLWTTTTISAWTTTATTTTTTQRRRSRQHTSLKMERPARPHRTGLNQFERVKTSLKNCCWNHEVSLKWYNSRITRRESNLRHDKLRHIIQCSITLSYFIRCSVTSNYVIRFCVTSSCVGPFNVASRNSFFMTSSNVSSCHIVVQHCVAPRLTLCYIASRQFASRGVAFEN